MVSRLVVKTYVAMQDHWSFEHASPKHANACVYMNLSLEMIAWTIVSEAGVNVASEINLLEATIVVLCKLLYELNQINQKWIKRNQKRFSFPWTTKAEEEEPWVSFSTFSFYFFLFLQIYQKAYVVGEDTLGSDREWINWDTTEQKKRTQTAVISCNFLLQHNRVTGNSRNASVWLPN